jgi:hypothetical protein
MMFHVSLIILLITHLSSLCSSSVLETCRFTFITIDVGGLIFSGQTIEVTVCTVNFSLASLEITI